MTGDDHDSSSANAPTEPMSGFEALMWNLERDPRLSSAFANLSLLDRAPDPDLLRNRMAAATRVVPRLRQRVVESANPFMNPVWEDDPDFDIDHHVRFVDLGGNATLTTVYETAALLSRQAFDRARPLWEFVVISGVEDGQAAMLQRLHHTITDGEGGIRLSLAFIDFERNPSPPATPQRDSTTDTKSEDLPTERARTAPSEFEAAPLVALPGNPLQRLVATLSVRSEQVTESAQQAFRWTQELPDLAASTLRQIRVGSHLSPLWQERSLDRWFGTTTLNLEEVRHAAKQNDGTVNDFFMTGAALAAGRYHQHFGVDVEELRVSMPVSTRHDRSAGGNAFSPTQLLVPVGNNFTPVELFAEVRERVTALRTERAIQALEGAAEVASRLPPVVLLRAGQHLAGSVDYVCSNVRAAPFDLYIAGALMTHNFPMGPLAGTAFNLTTMSYRGTMFLGLVIDPKAIEDPDLLLELVESSYAELLNA